MEHVINVADLKPHPKNSYFFDDITGEKWEEILESVGTRGVIEPIVITQDNTIVSGHQRVRACKELGIEEVKCEVREYDNEDDVILDLLDANEKQRGTIGGSTIKLGRRIKEYERIGGVRNGSANPKGTSIGSSSDNVGSLTQKDIADKLGISVDTLANAKKLASAPQEVQDAVETGEISPSFAIRKICSLPEDQQIHLVKRIPALQKITDQTVSEIKERLVQLEEGIDNVSLLIERVPSLQEWIDTGIMTPRILEKIAEQLSPEEYDSLSFVKVVDNTPDDYEKLKEAKKTLEDEISDLKTRISDEENYGKKAKELLKQIKTLTEKKDNLSRQIDSAVELSGLTVKLRKTLENDLAPIRFMRTMEVLETSDIALSNLSDIVNMVGDWYYEMREIINDKGLKLENFVDVEYKED